MTKTDWTKPYKMGHCWVQVCGNDEKLGAWGAVLALPPEGEGEGCGWLFRGLKKNSIWYEMGEKLGVTMDAVGFAIYASDWQDDDPERPAGLPSVAVSKAIASALYAATDDEKSEGYTEMPKLPRRGMKILGELFAEEAKASYGAKD